MLRLRRETRAERRLRLAGPEGAAKAASAIEVEGAISAAAGALADLCWNNAQNQGSLRDQGGLQLVLSLCKHRSPGVRAVVTRLLWNCVADNAQNRDVVLAEDGLNLIVQLLSDPNDEIQANAAGGGLQLLSSNFTCIYWPLTAAFVLPISRIPHYCLNSIFYVFVHHDHWATMWCV